MSNDLSKIAAQPEKPKDTQIAKVEEDLQAEKDSRKEERFYWIFGIILAFDAYSFPNAASWGGAAVLAIMQLVFLVVLAAWLGLDHISIFLSRVLGHFLKSNKPD